MDCDQVFKVLTSGPFPTGEPWDEQVESHLETCAECWRLAEALRPALEVFQEAVPAAEGRNLPGYWGDARPAANTRTSLATDVAPAAVAAGTRRVNRPFRAYERNAATREFSVDVLRTVALAAIMTVATLALVSLFR